MSRLPILTAQAPQAATIDESQESQRAAAGLDLAEEVLRVSGSVSLRVFGSSMLPAIWPGDIVTVHRASIAEITPGDIALFAKDGRFFVHRVVLNDGSSLLARGDSLTDCDPAVEASQVLGRVVAILRGRTTIFPKPTLNAAQKMFAHSIRRSVLLRGFAVRLNAMRLKLRA